LSSKNANFNFAFVPIYQEASIMLHGLKIAGVIIEVVNHIKSPVISNKRKLPNLLD